MEPCHWATDEEEELTEKLGLHWGQGGFHSTEPACEILSPRLGVAKPTYKTENSQQQETGIFLTTQTALGSCVAGRPISFLDPCI